ncbi:MAG TPA: hypothetical protein VIW22_01130, partial [Nitrososphaerales archaeon]
KEFRGKRGGLGGRKAVHRSPGFKDFVALEGSSKPNHSTSMLKPLLKRGKLVRSFKTIEELRAGVVGSLGELKTTTPSLNWR